ncbi:MAG: hypothetical protein QOK37_3575 [Thermoanaerobaculia bacterium]|jgi:hypothetical protein|nr:hypothetical protein [Thermoanaerobaculia bacterium]
MPLPKWHFRAMTRGEINVDPVHDEFFKAQDLADALVREAIQNSLDARGRGRSIVRVRFRLASGEQALSPEAAAPYLRGLEPHLSLPPFAAMPFLVVEDSGTRGLVGDPGEDPELDDHGGERNDFYYFWRNVGRSGKGELDRGRWGLGKAVFPVSSRIHTMFGLTRRADDHRLLLLGQSVVKTHVIDGKRFAPYGFFADTGRDDFPHAVEDAGATSRFIKDFGLERDDAGLSIVIPFFREDDLRFDLIVSSAIRQYFYPITRGDLIVTVEEESRKVMISSRTIERDASDPAVSRLCALARWPMTLPDDEWILIPEPPGSGAPKWQDDALPAAILDPLRERFEHGERLAFRVRVPVRRKRSRAMAHFDVVLEKDEALRRGEHQFIRRGITIPEVKSARDKPVRALLIADDETLSTFLGDAENPAHSDWSERNDKIRSLYEHGASTLRYVKNAIAQIASMLSTPPAGRAPDLLADIFSITIPNGEDVIAAGGSRRDRDPGGGKSPIAGVSPSARPSDLRLARIDGGFTLHGSAKGNAAGRWVIEMAYRTRTGDPFRKYSPYDFGVGRNGVAWKSEGATVFVARDNRVEIISQRPDFQFKITGFDCRRDLVVRVARKDDDAPEAELH